MNLPPILSEADIIQGYLAPLAAHYRGAFGLSDDAAAIAPPPGMDLVATMDAVAAGVHFFPDDPATDIAWKALAVNVSDLVAKGAAPHAYLMSLAFPEPPAREWLAGFAAGLASAQTQLGITLIGGDTDRRPGPLTITITALGLVPAGAMVQRGTARAGDHLFVSGTLGDSALGLVLRTGEPQTQSWPLASHERLMLIRRYLRPEPRLGLIPILRQHARAAMDISDGLIKDLGRMAALNSLGAEVHASQLPRSIPAGKVVAADAGMISALAAGGNDYEVLAAIPPDAVAAFRARAKATNEFVTQIGRMTSRPGVQVLDADGAPITFSSPGYDHF